MKNTRNIIKMAALGLFNKHGVSMTPMRDIARETNLSTGNITYYFKYKELIIEELYYDMVEEMSQVVLALQEKPRLSLAMVYESTYFMATIFHKYRFLVRDLYVALLYMPEIYDHFSGLQEARVVQFKTIFLKMRESGLMRAARFEKEYDRLITRMIIVSDNWVNYQDLHGEAFENDALLFSHYTDLIFEMVYPYLTKKGTLQYNSLTQDHWNNAGDHLFTPKS